MGGLTAEAMTGRVRVLRTSNENLSSFSAGIDRNVCEATFNGDGGDGSHVLRLNHPINISTLFVIYYLRHVTRRIAAQLRTSATVTPAFSAALALIHSRRAEISSFFINRSGILAMRCISRRGQYISDERPQGRRLERRQDQAPQAGGRANLFTERARQQSGTAPPCCGARRSGRRVLPRSGEPGAPKFRGLNLSRR